MDTHIIQKRDLLEMLSRFAGDSKIVVQAGGAVLFIDNVEYSGGSISIKCHNDIEDEREDLENTIDELRGQIRRTERRIEILLASDLDNKPKEEIIQEIQGINEGVTA